MNTEIKKNQILYYIQGFADALIKIHGYDEDKAFDMAIQDAKTSSFNNLLYRSALREVLLELEGD